MLKLFNADLTQLHMSSFITPTVQITKQPCLLSGRVRITETADQRLFVLINYSCLVNDNAYNNAVFVFVVDENN